MKGNVWRFYFSLRTYKSDDDTSSDNDSEEDIEIINNDPVKTQIIDFNENHGQEVTVIHQVFKETLYTVIHWK